MSDRDADEEYLMTRIIVALLVVAACGSPPRNTPPDAGVADGAPDAGPDAPIGPMLGDPFAALQSLPATCSSDQWCWRTPRPVGNDYHRIFATAADNLWLIGQHGTVMQWSGTAWTLHHPEVLAGQPAAQYPFAIAGRSAHDMWLIYGTTVEHWDGAAWTIADSLPPGGIVAFNSIWEAPDGEVWVTLNNGSVKRASPGGAFQLIATGCSNCFLGSIWGLASDDFFITTLPAGILHYDGHAFVRSYSGPLIAGSYQGTRNDVWVSGADGAVLHWDGAAWTTLSTGLDGWYVTGIAAVAHNDVWWWASRSSAMSAVLHWDGAALTTAPVDPASLGPSLYSGAIVDGRWWLVGASGAIYTRSGPGAVKPVVDPQVMGVLGMWGAGSDDMYFATGGEVHHWDGAAMTAAPVAASRIAGVHTAAGDELFATGFDVSPDRTQYIASGYHFDGTSWSRAELTRSAIADHHYITQVFAMAPGEAMAVGFGGIAYHYANGSWSAVTTGVTTDLMGVWGPDADHLWITGTKGTLLSWSRADPGVATTDPTLAPTANDLGAIHGAGGITWIAAGGDEVLMGTAAGWTMMSTGVVVDSIFAVDASNVVVASAGQSLIARWNGSRFVPEDNASGMPTPLLFRPPGGPMLAGGLWGIVQHP